MVSDALAHQKAELRRLPRHDPRGIGVRISDGFRSPVRGCGMLVQEPRETEPFRESMLTHGCESGHHHLVDAFQAGDGGSSRSRIAVKRTTACLF
jgi:hypothetical protein